MLTLQIIYDQKPYYYYYYKHNDTFRIHEDKIKNCSFTENARKCTREITLEKRYEESIFFSSII